MTRRLPLPRTRRARIATAVVVVLGLAASALAWQVLRVGEDTRIGRAVALAPATAQRYSWTDWGAVRAEVGDADLSAASSPEEVEEMLRAAFDRDLASGSALEQSAPTIHTDLGFSPATIDWELFAQAPRGAVVIMGLPDDFDLAGLRERLRAAGFRQPERADGVWRGGVDLLQGLSGPVTPELAALRIDADRRILYGSDSADFLARGAWKPREGRDDGVREVVDAIGDAVSASVFTGDYTCGQLAMSQADPADRTRAAELIEAAGGVHPLEGYGIAARPDGRVRVAMALEDERRARADADSRSKLAAGPAPGQGGDFADSFALDRAAAAGRVVTLDLTPREGAFVVSDLDHGPVLFAAC